MSRSKVHPSNQPTFENYQFVLLAGGVGGAKMADGFAHWLSPDKLTIIVNTGDDFVHCGLTICPDLDTVMYTLAGIENPETGWGRKGDSCQTMEELNRLGGPNWFSLGDLDLATHLARNQLLADGSTLTEVTRTLCGRLGIDHWILPMCDMPAPTMIACDEGLLPFQEWFVARRWQPVLQAVKLPEDCRASGKVINALEKADIVLIAPSNPFVSIDPILNVYPIREMLIDLPQMVVAVSPIIGGKAVKGPAAKMMAEMNLEVTSTAVADYYGELIDLFVYDQRDAEQVNIQNLATFQTDTLMADSEIRRKLAFDILNHTMELIEQ